MNKKGLMAVVVIIILVVGGYLVWGKGSTTVSNGGSVTNEVPANIPAGVTKDTYAPVTKTTADTTLIDRLKNVSVSAAETGSRVALVNGKAQFASDGVKGTISLGDIAVSKTIGGASYVIATLAVNSGGTSASQYAVLFTDKAGSPLADSSYALIGAGAQVTGVRADEVAGGFVVTVNYTLPTSGSRTLTKILVVENGAFNSAKEINL
jgi:hypothetical protein